MPQSDASLPTRVSVLEHGVQELKTGLDSHRGETRVAFSALQTAMQASQNVVQTSMEQLSRDIQSRGQPTNWNNVVQTVAGTIMIIGAIFGLNEWRINAALAPVTEARISRGVQLKEITEEINEMKVRAASRAAANDEILRRIRMEEDAHIRERIGRDAKAGRSERSVLEITKDPLK